MICLSSELLENDLKLRNSNNDEISLEYVKLVEIKPDAFKLCRNRKIKSLHLQNASKKEYKNLKALNNKHSSLFEPLKEHLKELHLSCILECDFNFLEHLYRLKWLNLDSSDFRHGKPVFNLANNQLEELVLTDCKLKISDTTMFNDLKCLKHLDLSFVRFGDNVLPGLFSELKQLESLTLSKIVSTKLAEDAFIHLENLKELYLGEIEISIESSNIFAPLKRLEKLEMGCSNAFNYDAYGRVRDLREIALYFLPTIEIDENFFGNHPNLESLDLSDLNTPEQDLKTQDDKYWIDLESIANLAALKSLNLSNNNLKFDRQDCETIFSFAHLETLDLSIYDREKFTERELKLNETTFKRMTHLRHLNLNGNRIKLEGNCFKHLNGLRELDLSQTIFRSDNNEEYDILSSLKQLEKFEFYDIEQQCDLFQLYKLSELVNLKMVKIFAMNEHDLDQFREILRRKRRRTIEIDQPNVDPTYNDLCFFILRHVKKLTSLRLISSHLTYIDKRFFQMKDLSILDLAGNGIQHIPDDTFDCLSNLEEIDLTRNSIRQIKLNRLFLNCDKLRKVSFDQVPVVDLMDERFNFKSLVSCVVNIDYFKSSQIEFFYHSRRAFIQRNPRSISADSAALGSEMNSVVSNMFQTIDFKLNEIKSVKEKSIKQQVKPFVDQIQLDPIEDKLNQVRQEMIDKLKEIHDTSINEMNALIKKYKQQNHWSNKSMREESLKEATQSAEKILKNQLKLPTSSYSRMPTLSNFFKLTHSNAFKSMQLVKYAALMPELFHTFHNDNQNKLFIPIKKDKLLVINAPDQSLNISDYLKSSDKCSFEIHDFHTGLINSQHFDDNPSDVSSLNSISDTFSIVNNHLVTVRNYNAKSANSNDEFIHKFTADRVDKKCSIEFHYPTDSSFTDILLIDIFDFYLNKTSQATIKYSNANEAYVYTCGTSGVLVESRRKTKRLVSHYFALYSLRMKLKRKRIRIDFRRIDSAAPIEFKPIKFDDEKCFIYKYNQFEYSMSILIYSFTDTSLLQSIDICIPPQNGLNKMMAIDSENTNLYFICAISRSINCFNLQSNDLVTSHLAEMTFNELIMADDDERFMLFNTADAEFIRSIHFYDNIIYNENMIE